MFSSYSASDIHDCRCIFYLSENSGLIHQQIFGFDLKNFAENLTNCDDNAVEKCKHLCGQQVFANSIYKLIKIILYLD